MEEMLRFILRVSYVSHHHWYELFLDMARMANEDHAPVHLPLLVEMIEQDAVFACNLLQSPPDVLCQSTPLQRRITILNTLKAMGTKGAFRAARAAAG